MFDIDLGVASSLSVTLLIIGIGMSVFPPLISKMRGKSNDFATIVTIGVLLLILVVASQAVFLVRRYPDILYPLVGITLCFRVFSPTIFVVTLQEKFKSGGYWKSMNLIFILISLGFIFYTFISWMTNKTNVNLAVSERLLMTMAVAYTYARIYLKLFRKLFFDWEEKYILFSGLLIGVSFVILIPFLVPEFDGVYKLTGTVGWLGAFLTLYMGKPFYRRSDRSA